MHADIIDVFDSLGICLCQPLVIPLDSFQYLHRVENISFC